MKKKKRWIGLLLMAVMMVTGCTTGDADGGSNQGLDSEGVIAETINNDGTYYYEKNLLDGGAEMAMAQLDDGTVLAVNKSTGEKILVIAPDGSQTWFETGVSAPVRKFGSNGSDKILLNYVGETANEVHRFDLKGNALGTIVLNDFTQSEETMVINVMGDTVLYEYNGEIFTIAEDGNLKAWNLETKAVRLVRENVEQILTTNGKTVYFNGAGGAMAGVTALDLETDQEKQILEDYNGWIAGLSKTQTGFVALDQEWNLIVLDEAGEKLGRESLLERFDEVNSGMKMCADFYMQGSRLYLTMLDFSGMVGNGSQSFYLLRKAGEDPALANKSSLVIYAHHSDMMFEFYLRQYLADHPDVRIQLVSHEELSQVDYLKKINTEILSGKKIDMVFLDGLPVKKLNQKGFFEDLSPWLDSDLVQKADKNVMEIVRQDGKLIGLPVNLRIDGLYAEKTDKTETIFQRYLDSKQSFDDFSAMADSLLDMGIALFRDLEPEVLLRGLIAANMGELLDENGVFNADLFKDILAFVEKYNKEPYMDQDMSQDHYDYYGPKGKIALEPLNDAEMMQLAGTQARFESEAIFLLPYPRQSGGYGISATMIGLLRESQNKKEAVAFLQAMALDEEVQRDKALMQSIPVRFDVMEAAMSNPESDIEMTFAEMIETTFGERMLQAPSPTWAEGSLLVNFFQNGSRAMIGETQAVQMILDSAKRYFAGEADMAALIGSLRNQFLLYANE